MKLKCALNFVAAIIVALAIRGCTTQNTQKPQAEEIDTTSAS
jgi:hypothetical protein